MGIDVEGEARTVAEQIIGGIAVGQKWGVQDAAASITAAMKHVSERENAELRAKVDRLKWWREHGQALRNALAECDTTTISDQALIALPAKLRAECDKLREEVARLDTHWEHNRDAADYLLRHGYRRCNIAACNCGSWHGGDAMARLDEIRQDLVDAGFDTNGTTIRGALKDALESGGGS